VAGGIAIALFIIVVVAPVISPYRILLSVATFGAWSSLLALPRLAFLGAALWRGLSAVLFFGGWRSAWVPAILLMVFDLVRTENPAPPTRVVRGAELTWFAVPPGTPPTLVIGPSIR